MLEDWQAGEMKPESPLRNGLVLEVKMPEAAEAERKFVKLKYDLKICTTHFTFQEILIFNLSKTHTLVAQISMTTRVFI